MAYGKEFGSIYLLRWVFRKGGNRRCYDGFASIQFQKACLLYNVSSPVARTFSRDVKAI